MIQTFKQIPLKIRKILQEVSSKDVLNIRINGIEGIVIKLGDKYYLLTDNTLKKDIKYLLGEHLCFKCNFCFGTLCPKIFDLSIGALEEINIMGREAICETKRIEKYDFITKGVEAFNCNKSYFVVSECRRFKPDGEKKN